jgi:pimeloyl-ACP methyl ester carboxylesterase
MPGHRARTLRQFAPGPRRAPLAAIHHATPSHAAIDGDGTPTPRAQDIRHGALPLSTDLRTVNVTTLPVALLRRAWCVARLVAMDPLALMVGATALGAIGYRRPTDLFRAVLRAALRARGFKSRRIRLPDGGVHYWRGGRGTPLVLVHGFGTEAAVNWYHQMVACVPTFDVVAPDLPGFGGSDRLSTTNCIALQVRCIAALLDRLGLQRVALVGHSMGGWISLAFAATFPERVTRLVVVDAAGLRFDPDVTLERALLPQTVDDVRLLIRANFRRAVRLPAFVLRDLLRGAQRDAVPRTELLQRLVYGDEHLDDRLRLITAPTLVVWGRADTLTPLALGERIVSAVPKARLVVYEDSAHSPNVEQPARFNRLLSDFLRSPIADHHDTDVRVAVG